VPNKLKALSSSSNTANKQTNKKTNNKKHAMPFLLLLCLLFNKIGEEGRTGSAQK
jgi:hypothetical protein